MLAMSASRIAEEGLGRVNDISMTRRKYWLVVASLLLASGLVHSAFLLRFVRTFCINRDDFPLVFNSAQQYHHNPAWWVTRGYSSYFSTYPRLPELGGGYCRPVVNATFWLESLCSPGIGPLYLITNFLGVGITLLLFALFVHRETGGNVLSLSSVFILFAFSPIWYLALLSPSFRTTALMALFGLSAFLVLPSEGSKHRGLRMALSLLFQMASILSHEVGIATPVIAALLYVFRRDGTVARGRLRGLPLFLLPVLSFAALRLVFYGGVSHVDVLEPQNGWAWKAITGAVELLAKPFFPWETAAVTGGEWSLRVVVGALMNLAGYALVGCALLRPGKAGRRRLLRPLLCLGVTLALLWIAPTVRFMQLAAVFGVLVVMVAVEQISQGADQGWVRRGLALGLVGLAVGQLLIYLTSFPQMVAEGEAQNRVARVEFEGLEKAIATGSVPTLLLVNDQSGNPGSQAMLEMAAWPDRRHVRRLVAVDYFSGGSGPQSSLRISRDKQAVRIEIIAGPDQQFAFPEVDVKHAVNKFVIQGLHYEMETLRTYSFIARLLRCLGKKVEPDRVVFGHRLLVTVPPEIARDGLLIVGFDPRNMTAFSNDLTM